MAGTVVVVSVSEFVPDDDAALGFGKLLVEANDFVGVLLAISVVRGFKKKSFVLA